MALPRNEAEARMAADALMRAINPPIITGVDYGAGESFTAWSVFNEGFKPATVHSASSIKLEELAPGVWGRRV